MEKTGAPVLKIVLADKQALVRAGIRCLIERIEGVEVVDDTHDGQQLLQLVGQHRPDMVITEINLNGLSGLEFTEQSCRHYPEVPVLILSDQTSTQAVRAALKAGISSFVTKDAGVQELSMAIQAVAKGQSYFSPSVSRSALDQRRSQAIEKRPTLTPRQRQIMQLLARGRTTKEIASIVGIGTKTVETHRARLKETLRLKNSNELIHYAIRHGFDGHS